MKSVKPLYFIAVLPPPDISGEITEFKEDFATRFGSKSALRIVPHITLKAPFHLETEKQADLLEWFRQLPVDTGRFDVVLKGFGMFPKIKAPVIYVQVKPHESLFRLQESLLQQFRRTFPECAVQPTELQFHPHITIAYRDLSPELFPSAWKEYALKSYEANFSVDTLTLFQHDGQRWNTLAERQW